MFFKNQRIGKYQILDTIGSGGFGAVYLARDVLIDKKVAVKVPHKQGENVEKLLQEPRLLAALNHPNIVSVITAENTNNVFYIVMEYVDGESLEQIIRRVKGPLKVEICLDWFIKVGEALAYAHSKNILHRDIRPANVLISREGQVKVADLGTSRYLVEDHHASTRIGSPPYMAPEHFQGKATLQSDVYSMGVLMYECLTGRLPFYDKNPKILAQMVRDKQAVSPTQLNTRVPPTLARIIARAMHRKLTMRYNSAEALVADLKRVDLNEPAESIHHPTQTVNEERRAEPKFFPRDLPTREISNLFCWNCSKPIQKRTRNCPHCRVSLK